jgi:hypothetical protein
MMPAHLTRTRIERWFRCRENVLPHQCPLGVGVFSFQRKRQINFAVAPGKVLSMDFLDATQVIAQRPLIFSTLLVMTITRTGR